MRGAILSLLLINVIYFGIGFYQQSQNEYVIEQPETHGIKKEGEELVLLTEYLSKTFEPYRANNNAGMKVNKPSTCYTIGVFEDKGEAILVQQHLAIMGATGAKWIEQEGGDADHWVYLPPQPSRESTNRLQRELQQQGIDSYVISQGELTNGLSLGLFADGALAEEVLNRARTAGYPAKVQVRPAEPHGWIVEVNSEFKNVIDAQWQQIMAKNPNVQQQKKTCQGIASSW